MKTKVSTLFMGVDPGVTGAVALIDSRGKLLSIQDAPVIVEKKAGGGKRSVYVEPQMLAIVVAMRDAGTVAAACVENVHSMPNMGVASMFQMGVGFGYWRMALTAAGVPYQLVEPKVWKHAMGIPAGSDKSASVVRALRLFPRADLTMAKHDGRADALLLAEYLRRVFEGIAQPAAKASKRAR